MKIWIDGVCRDMTAEEEAEYNRLQAEEEQKERQREATDLERIEAQTMYTALMTDTLIGEE